MEPSHVNEPAVHRIRLKGPWEIQRPGKTGELLERISMPMAWRELFGDISGTALFYRNFHLPSGLEAKDHVLIHIPSGTGKLSGFSINDQPVQPCSSEPLKFDVTDHLTDFNRLQFSLTFDPLSQKEIPGGLWETVFVEIHAAQQD